MSALDALLARPKITHDLVQGSDAWHQFRLAHRGASETGPMLGLSKKVTRTELLHAKHTGIAREFSDFVQERVLDRGHEVEALARPLVEAMLGEDLYPVTCSRGLLSASCDGITLDDRTAFEHKQWNEELAAVVRAGQVPDDHMAQCQQILLVTGAERVRFAVSDGTPDRLIYVDVTPDRSWWERIVAGWAQFDKDLSSYTPAAAEPPKPTGHAPETLPALRIEITGAVTASNLAEFKATALGAIRSVNRELTTDQHFADAEQAVKWCSEVETRIKAAKDHALSQTATIEELFRTLDDVSAEVRRVRLDLEKLVTRRKEELKGEMVAGAKAAYDQHIAQLKADAGAWIDLQAPDFGGAIKGKRNVASMQDALDTSLAAGKIAADDSARKIRAALAALDDETKGWEHLFADRKSFITKAPEDVRTLARARITEHQAAEQRRAAEAAEKERERIRQEEAARLEREQAAQQAAEAQRQADAARAAAAAMAPPAPPPALAPPAPSVVQMPARATAPATPAGPPTLKLGEVNARLSPHIATTEAGLAALGFEATKVKGACLYHEQDWPAICDAIVTHVQDVRDQRAAA
jgi:predicted phage-related endonuclease